MPDGGGYPASPEDYSVNAVDQLSGVNQMSGSPEELSINAVNQLAMAGLVDGQHHQQQFQGRQLHHLQPPVAPGSSLVIPKQEYHLEVGEQQQLSYGQQQMFENIGEPGSHWSQEVKVESHPSIQCRQTSTVSVDQINFSQQRQDESSNMDSQYPGRQEYPYVGGLGQYGDANRFKDAMYTGITEEQQQYSMDSHHPLAGFPSGAANYQVGVSDPKSTLEMLNLTGGSELSGCHQGRAKLQLEEEGLLNKK